MMKIDTHPTTEDIVAFLEEPDSVEYQDLELHLASCSNCRTQLNQLSQLQKDIQSSDFIQQQLMHGMPVNKSNALEAALADGKIEDYVDQKLDNTEFENIDKLVKDDPQALKAALHYASHQSAMQRELSEFDESSNNSRLINSRRIGYFDLVGLLKKCFTFRAPAWLMVPVTGFASVLLVFSMNTQFAEQESTMKIASYQDNAVIQFSGKSTQPGIGFFSNAFTKVKPFKYFKIKLLKNNTLQFSWPKVENAKNYTIELNKIEKGQNILLGEISGINTIVEFTDIPLESSRRYQWVLTGKTTTGETFFANGGFVTNVLNEH